MIKRLNNYRERKRVDNIREAFEGLRAELSLDFPDKWTRIQTLTMAKEFIHFLYELVRQVLMKKWTMITF